MTGSLRIKGNEDAALAIFLLAASVAFCILVPLAWPLDPLRGDISATFKPPMTVVGDALHPLGTDQLGRDLLARLGLGTLVSFGIVLIAALISVVLGTALGMIAGYYGGWVDALIMRLVDIQLAVPFILLILLLVSVLGPSMTNLVIVLGLTGWAIFARVARGRTLEVRELEYIDASRAMGLSDTTIIFRHVLPNIIGPQTVLLTLDLPRLIILEASVGFLGLGVQPPMPTLGNLIGEGRSVILIANWLVLYPGLMIGALVIGCNLLGDWLVRRAESKVS
ncbi:peptide/nickel transport system permease protein [Mameliella alba]|uniref:ABC transporter permease n=1 Tax=Mameliella TaxID=1434019 RepID=UPI0008410800|nr:MULTISPECIES: ABC transporter permease [Mameliella]MDD9733231.1 ABC transporter permease [Mameliella sp. AT18]ODM49777.1 peptide ABC transporter permease [Ruegeria sp. PBVC088]PTR36556.1 peptide/nickel transport system permease protein [Mameliella alba]SDC76619.1 peptide/nickel transport system permease protein [Mameliella alba]